MTPRATTPSPTTPFPATLQSVYVVSPHPFAEVDAFVEASTAQFHLDLRRYSLDMKDALAAYLVEKPRLKAVFVGTRRTDPHGAKLTHFDPTDGGWPAFVRVHPVIDWHYAEIWAVSLMFIHTFFLLFVRGKGRTGWRSSMGGRRARIASRLTVCVTSGSADLIASQFLRHLKIPYISLYDQGYTSLGGTQDTFPNPKLKRADGEEGFRPAYELIEDDEERLGRDR